MKVVDKLCTWYFSVLRISLNYGVLTESKNQNIIIVKIILVQPICTQKLLGNSSLVVAQGCDQVVAQGCYQVAAQGCDQVVAQGCYQVVAQGCDQVVAQGCYQVATTCLQPCNNFGFETVSTL